MVTALAKTSAQTATEAAKGTQTQSIFLIAKISISSKNANDTPTFSPNQCTRNLSCHPSGMRQKTNKPAPDINFGALHQIMRTKLFSPEISLTPQD